jgi:hypothetical protein
MPSNVEALTNNYGGCVVPRLLLGLHESGGITGLFGIVVHT